MADREIVIEAKELSYRYDGADCFAVDHLNFTVRKGEFVAVLGRNGSGKSTLGKLLNGLIAPTEGDVTVCGIPLTSDENTYRVKQKCGMVFQNPDNQIVATIVEEDVAFGPENLGVPPEEIRARVDAALSTVGMCAFAQSAPHMLSGGQKQRVAIAGVIAMKPELIVFDEATSMLDPSGREEVMGVARKLNRDEGVTVVWITHFMNEAAQADRIVVIDKGAIALSGAPREVFTDAHAIAELGLEAPEMAYLSQRLREAGVPLSEGILSVDEMAVELCRLKLKS